MAVLLDVGGEVVVDHVLQPLDVDAAGCHISGQEDVQLAL